MGFASLFGGERGNSDYDIRQNLNFTGSYLFPSTSVPVVKTILGNWYADFMLTARTGLPFDIQGVTATTSSSSSTTRGLFAQVRPDYNGQQVWLTDPNVPAGTRLNAAAFAAPAKYTTGNLGRNALSGYKMGQVDFSLRRQIPVTDSIRFHLALQAFNVTNSPNFLNPTRNEGASMASANFGVSTRTLGQGMGGGAGSFYRSGGPRSIQFTLRLQF